MKFGTIDISNTPVSIFMSKIIFIKYLAPVRPKLVPKLKVIRICWNLAYSIFLIRQPRFWCQKWFLWIIYLLLGPNWSQNQECSGLLKFGTYDISNISISLLMSKIIFIKYLPLVRRKLVAKLKVLIIYWNLAHSIFQICQSKFWCQKWFLWNIYLLPVQIKPKIKTALKFMFDISSIPILNARSNKVSLNNHYMLCQNWSPSLNSNLDYKM